jgi:PKD repeat protein
MKKLLIIGVIIVLAATSILSGCVETGAVGTLRLQITDKPGDLDIIYANVTISMVQVHKSGADDEDEEEDEVYENIDEYDDGFIADADGPYEAEVKEDIQFIGDATGGDEPYNWSWDFGDGNSSYEQTPLYNYSVEGVYIVNLTVTDEDGAGVIDWYVTTAKIGEDDDSEAGWYTIVEESQTFDLIALQDVTDVLGEEELTAGKYTQIRLTVEKANITINNDGEIEVHDLKIPSNKVKLIKPFWIYKDETTVLTLDFDVYESVHKTGNNKYMMKPTIKVIQE